MADFSDVKDVLSRCSVAVLATASSSGIPEASNIEFVSDLKDIYFVTQTSARKYKNILENPRGCLVLTQIPQAIQIDGEIRPLEKNYVQIVAQNMSARLGQSPNLYKNERWKFFRFIPGNVIYSQYPKLPSGFQKFENSE